MLKVGCICFLFATSRSILCVTVPSGGEGFYFANNNFDGFRLDHQNPCRRAPDCGKLTKCRTETARRQRRINTKKAVPEEITKHSFRLKVWRHLETNGLAMFPRPVYNRIPNFKGAPEAAAKLAELDVFKNATTVKVNPDKPQEAVRVLCLEQQKTLYVPVPRLQKGFLNRLELPEGETGPSAIRKAVSRNGMESYGKPIGIEDTVSLDLVVMGSVAVSKEGYRIGKGRGYGDLEFGLMMHMKAIKPNTVVATTVHDCQVKKPKIYTIFTVDEQTTLSSNLFLIKPFWKIHAKQSIKLENMTLL
ncbi:methenyltetrahydrofolate synthase domain-containing protein-like [Trichoplusia ni]|uniref:Methenyltetrahydrofolate synthase domain-containing protein-like n=1 Tax=Trichoplusia ni TaxID=7111 RepID=A0A7E5VMC4_TRINI|nr:methenyltetrahydrofolate synthase domain-containing protein-like [Trichoplusia ni]